MEWVSQLRKHSASPHSVSSQFLSVCSAGQINQSITDEPTVHLSLTTSLSLSPSSLLTATLTCLVDSSPPATLTWARDGLEVRRVETNTSSVLELLEVRPEEAWLGNYSCTATTETDSQTASVLVTGESNVMGSNTFTMFGFLNYSIFHVGFSFFHFTIHVVVMQVVRWLPW